MKTGLLPLRALADRRAYGFAYRGCDPDHATARRKIAVSDSDDTIASNNEPMDDVARRKTWILGCSRPMLSIGRSPKRKPRQKGRLRFVGRPHGHEPRVMAGNQIAGS